METIRIAHLYYDLMNLYGENGNIRFLKKKLEDQGIEAEIHFLTIDDEIDFDKYDFFYIGTGSEENEFIVLEDLLKYKEVLKQVVKNKFFLATGNALELFGKEIIMNDGSSKQALNVFDYISKEEEFRIVGEQYYETNLDEHKLVGFQNRACSMKDVKEGIFKVIQGCGFSPNEQEEGYKKNHFYGTYLLGPILVRNPYFCDYLIRELFKEKKITYKKPDYTDSAYLAYNELINNFYEKK